MIIRIQAAGGSFRGAGLYYLHDKAAEKDAAKSAKPKTDERVWFMDTRNCANDDPAKALDEMWHVAESQQWLKQMAGGRTSGRSCADPVKTIAIAWAKEDEPTPEHMVAAADAYLKHMGWDAHQAVFVGHRDTEHRHVHIILNRVNHENGKTLDDYRDHPRSQAFALQYEKEMGKLWCVEREVNAAEREKRAPDLSNAAHAPAPDRTPANEHIPYNVIEIQRPYEKLFEAHEKAELQATLDAERATLKDEQRAEREAWFKDGKRLIKETRHAVYDAVRAEFREDWKQFYRDRDALEKGADAASETALGRALHLGREGEWQMALNAFGDRNAFDNHVSDVMAGRLAALKAERDLELKTRQEEAVKELIEARKEGYKELLARQRDERAAMRAAHAQGQSAEHVLEARHDAAEQGKANDNAPAYATSAATSQQPQQEITPNQRAEQASGRNEGQHASATLQETLTHAAEALRDERSTQLTEPSPPVHDANDREPLNGPADLAAGAIGAIAGYVAEQFFEFVAPTPPEVREQRAKEDAKRETEAPKKEPERVSPWARQIEAAIRVRERDEEEKRSRDYWTERDKSKDYDRER